MDRSVGREGAARPPHTAERLCLSESGSTNLRERLRLDQAELRHSLSLFKTPISGKAEPYRTELRRSRAVCAGWLFLSLILFAGCTRSAHRTGIPADAQTVLDTAIEDINAGRYEKLYNDAADEWRRDTTLEESKATFERLREKLGRASVRNLQTAREEQTGTGPVAGHSLIAIYQTSFENGHAMETFTLIERGGKWYLAKYFVSSTALQ